MARGRHICQDHSNFSLRVGSFHEQYGLLGIILKQLINRRNLISLLGHLQSSTNIMQEPHLMRFLIDLLVHGNYRNAKVADLYVMVVEQGKR